MVEKKTISIKVDRELLKLATKKIENQGLNLEIVIHRFINEIIEHKGLPFEIKNPKNE